MFRMSSSRSGFCLALTALVSVLSLFSRQAQAGPESILPAASAVKGWKQIGAPKLYNPGNLYDLIDGEAQAILNYTFVACAHAEYGPASAAKPSLTIDVFDMTDPLNAYGLFGSDRRSGKPVNIGAEGVRIGDSALNFWKGRYVVRTTIVQNDAASKTAQEGFAKATAAKISGASAVPALISSLPAGYQKNSQNYLRVNVAGQSYLKNGVTARYASAGPQAELFVIANANPAAAKSAYAQFSKYVTDPKNTAANAKPAPLKGVGESALGVRSKFSGEIVVAVKGKSLIIVRKAKTPADAQKLAQAAIAKAK